MKTGEYRPCEGRRGLSLWLKIVLSLLLVGALCFSILLGIVLAGDRDEVRDPRMMIILGCQVKPWGPSVLLQDRLDRALDYLVDHPDMVVVCSGGQGANEHISEAECMAEYLIARGIPAENILLEDRSFNTWQNLCFSISLLAELGYDTTDNIMVVSNGWHLARVRMLYDRLYSSKYLSTLAAPSSDLPARLYSTVREVPGLVKSFLFDR